ncbi:MAG TPA: hypothetical protein VLF66_17365 [Thermoanaerobaculia bacterium]|nr:hypothetical protein [Thermoanaerobaculia bacterium]
MSRASKSAVVTLATVALLATVLAGQGGPGQGRGTPNYDPATEIRVTGTVKEVEYPDSPKGWQGVHLVLAAGDTLYDVHLEPRSYVEEEGFSFTAGDEIEVLGSQTQCRGEDAFVAREIRSGERTLKLRDGDGRPLWARGLGR